MKRIFDFTSALLIMLLVSPVIVVTAVLVATKLGRPVFFKQIRPGYKGFPFEIVKFRTMTNETDDEGELLPNKDRMTSFGKLLRSTSLDELPELINVLKGEMSLVGPRPLRMHYLELYNDFQKRRHDVRPGITGWAQVNGRNAISWDEKFKMDVWYVENQSFWLDLKILFLTVLKVLKRDDIAHKGDVAMPPFEGNNMNESGYSS